MKLASLAVARGERHLSLVREPVPGGGPAAALPAWRRAVGAAVVVLSLGLLTVAAVTWSVLA